MKLNIIYITAKDKVEAKKIARVLVEERLAACANIIENVNSVYWWEGKIEEGKEAVIVAKTKGSLVPELINKVKSLHSYKCPCIVSLPLVDGNKDYLDWILAETK